MKLTILTAIVSVFAFTSCTEYVPVPVPVPYEVTPKKTTTVKKTTTPKPVAQPIVQPIVQPRPVETPESFRAVEKPSTYAR